MTTIENRSAPSARPAQGTSGIRRSTAWTALTGNPVRFLLSAWPWRALVYGLVSAVVTVLLFVGQLTSVALAPIWGIVLGAVDRRRVALLGYDRIATGHVRIPLSRWRSWVPVRATEAATWREVANLGAATVLGLPLVFLVSVDLYAVAYGGAFFVARDMIPLSPLASDFVADIGGRYSVTAVIIATVIALVYLVVHSYLVTAITVAQARLSGLLLSPRQEELEAHVARLSASREALVAAFESERVRIERDLHDGAQQRLVALTMSLGLAELEARRAESDGAAVAPVLAAIAEAHTHAEQALAELRRTVRGVRPPVLSDHGLRAAVDELVNRFPIPVTLTDETVLAARFAPVVENCGYFFVSEALTNAMRHSSASTIDITLRAEGRQLVIAVSDDGRGGASTARGSGLTGLAERAAMLGGSVTIDSPPGGPTILTLSLPTSEHASSPAA